VSRFEGRVALVTGAASGIGAATAQLLRDEGAAVVGVDVAEGPGVLACDVTDRERVREVVEAAVAEHGGIDVVANVAGVVRLRHFVDVTPEEWQLHLAVNVTGPFHVIQAALPSLLERGGNVVSVASIAGLRGQAYSAGYGASKAALVNLTKGLAVEYASRGVRFNCVCPGTVMTPLVLGVAESMPTDLDPVVMARINGVMPGFIDPAEVAEAIAYLASDAARSVTGEALTIDLGVVC
jgi:meso-butanediol dehydrogenase / (S,S)-butanediol dehydrogenase / diacetyl reductase